MKIRLALARLAKRCLQCRLCIVAGISTAVSDSTRVTTWLVGPGRLTAGPAVLAGKRLSCRELKSK
ncbi:hypothetical protein PR003_g21604 [Phytophthora rubi]|uniref:Uncharacterized protein n=1 Tax=Phytophthora rubi TaxID=129364 RepID=A0A6A3JG64_9STRA|nr:hypothetical protein PR002_g20774 [Phytophthora rubi]KAE8994166.1 hypothetical protein PR001_g20473 [Phytophthora rubi]KAE9305027.1 hypothetical protein PR003_g21604 [Phytophthora rubi]